MNDYKPNSHRSKAEQQQTEKKKMDKVVTGAVKTRKKGELRKITDSLIAEDAKSVGSFILTDVVIPNIINLVEDIVIKGIRMFLRGDAGSSSSKRSGAGYISYKSFSDRKEDSYSNDRFRSGYGYDDIILETRGEAEEVLDRLREAIEVYDMVSVADLYDLVGKSCNYTDNKYGWTNLRNAEPIRVRDGYLLKMPKAMPLN